MTTVMTLNGIQGRNPNKDMARNDLITQLQEVAKAQGHCGFVSMPASGWIAEKIMRGFCKDKGIPYKIIGIDNAQVGGETFNAIKQNMPKDDNFIIRWGDYDVNARRVVEFHNHDKKINAFWADYCGDFWFPKHPHGEKYPHFNAFFDIIKAMGDKPFVYYMTFRLFSRQGENMNSDSKKYAGKIRQLIDTRYHQMVKSGKIKDNVIPVFQWIYKGHHGDMITIGFAVNIGKVNGGSFYAPLKNPELVSGLTFAIVNKIQLDPIKVEKSDVVKVKDAKASQVVSPNLWKQAVKILYDGKIPNADIATLLNLSRSKVGAVLSHHCHPDSFK